MPKIKTIDDKARRVLFSGNITKLCRETGIDRGTLYRRKAHPGRLTLDEFALIATNIGLDADEIYKLISERG